MFFLAALALEALHKQVLPFLLRRLKEDVLNDLPPKIIQDYYCELSELQKYLYDDFSKSQAGHVAENVVRSDEGGKQQHVFQSLQYLRKLCNHPALVLKDKETVQNVLTKIGQGNASLDLSDIQFAPKLLALRYVSALSRIVWFAHVSLSDNYSQTVALAWHRAQRLTLRRAKLSIPKQRQQVFSRSIESSYSVK